MGTQWYKHAVHGFMLWHCPGVMWPYLYCVRKIMLVWTHTHKTSPLPSNLAYGFSEPHFLLCLRICLFWIQLCLFSSLMYLQFIISLVFHGSALSSVPETPRVVHLVLPFERLQLFPISTRFPPPLRRPLLCTEVGAHPFLSEVTLCQHFQPQIVSCLPLLGEEAPEGHLTMFFNCAARWRVAKDISV